MAKILIVDDSITSRKVLRNILEAKGHTIIGEASNGYDGIQKYIELEPDLTTMDITMPDLDGIEALHQITTYNPAAKVIMVTAAAQQNKMLEALKYGATDFLQKPFVPDKITNMVDLVLDR